MISVAIRSNTQHTTKTIQQQCTDTHNTINTASSPAAKSTTQLEVLQVSLASRDHSRTSRESSPIVDKTSPSSSSNPHHRSQADEALKHGTNQPETQILLVKFIFFRFFISQRK